jgi:REP element-mobilizing transposase RayT
MARRIRIQFPGARYHIINRGNYRQDVFAREGAWQAFIRTLGEAAALFRWQVHAYVAMSNHYHVALETVAQGARPRIRPNQTCSGVGGR